MKSEIGTWMNEEPSIRSSSVGHTTSIYFLGDVQQFVKLYCEHESEDLELIFNPSDIKSPLKYISKTLDQESIGLITRRDIFEKDINELRKIRPSLEDKYKVKMILRKNESMEIKIVFWDE